MRAWFWLPFVDEKKVVGSFWRERRGVRSTVTVTRYDDAKAKFLIVPPGEWEQDEAEWAIKRGQELAREHGW